MDLTRTLSSMRCRSKIEDVFGELTWAENQSAIGATAFGYPLRALQFGLTRQAARIS